jgi:hypothetical protein
MKKVNDNNKSISVPEYKLLQVESVKRAITQAKALTQKLEVMLDGSPEIDVQKPSTQPVKKKIAAKKPPAKARVVNKPKADAGKPSKSKPRTSKATTAKSTVAVKRKTPPQAKNTKVSGTKARSKVNQVEGIDRIIGRTDLPELDQTPKESRVHRLGQTASSLNSIMKLATGLVFVTLICLFLVFGISPTSLIPNKQMKQEICTMLNATADGVNNPILNILYQSLDCKNQRIGKSNMPHLKDD